MAYLPGFEQYHRKHTVNHTMISASSFPAKDPLVDLSYILVFCERHLSAILWGLCY